MTISAAAVAHLDDLSRLSRQQWIVRIATVLCPIVVLAAEVAAGGSFGPVYLLVVLVLVLLAAAFPDGGSGLTLVIALALHWAVAVPDPTSAWLLVAAFGILGLHVTGTLATYGPTSLVLQPVFIWLWVRRAAGVATVTTVVWFGVRVASGQNLPGSGLLLGVALVVVAGWAVFVGRYVLTRE